MGKAQKIKVSKKNAPAPNGPLADQLATSNYAQPSGRVKERQRLDDDEDFVESRLSKNIMTQARLQVRTSQYYCPPCHSSVSGSVHHYSMMETRYSCGRVSPGCQLPCSAPFWGGRGGRAGDWS